MAGISVICVEPDPIVGRFIQRELGARGCDVTLAGTSDAVNALRDVRFQAAVLRHPGGDRVAAALLSVLLTQDPTRPVFALTSENGSRQAAEVLRAGARDCIALDLTPDVIERLDDAIRASVAAERRQGGENRDLRSALSRFEALAAERQILLHEVNHRVGNSLQLVGAFLHMQSSSSASPETRQALDEANRRVIAIAQLHKRLYATDDVQSVALNHYLGTLVEDIRLSTDAEGIGDLLSISAAEVSTDPDNAVTIGIIVTELVINAMKYAYPGSRGPIRIALQSIGPPGMLRLAVEDDGVGTTQRSRSVTGIGRTIIGAMATKLGTKVDYDETETGTRASMTFLTPARADVR